MLEISDSHPRPAERIIYRNGRSEVSRVYMVTVWPAIPDNIENSRGHENQFNRNNQYLINLHHEAIRYDTAYIHVSCYYYSLTISYDQPTLLTTKPIYSCIDKQRGVFVE